MAEHDAEVLRRIAEGNEDALHQLYLAYRPRLRRYLWHQLGGNEAAVEDVLQETFVAIWQSAPTFRGDARVLTWVFQIAHHRLAHLRRDLARRPEGHLWVERDDGEDGAREPIAPDAPVEDVVVDAMLLAEALERLSAKHREVLELVFLQGFSLGETAAVLGVPEGTVKSRVSYARRALAEALAETHYPQKEAR